MKNSLVRAGLGATVVALATQFAVAFPAVGHADPAPGDSSTRLAGKTVFLDPGHQGTGHNENLSRQVSDGRGGTKDCQTTGMTTVNGVPEHTITWQVAQLVKTSLESLGARVVLSRQDDTGWGGCVDDRARAANDSHADVAVSIHADGGPAEGRGFHLIVPELPIPDPVADAVQSGPGRAASASVRDAYLKYGSAPANYLATDNGLQTRADVAGPALTQVPDVFVEMGNGANPEDAKLLESGEGQLAHAVAITTGIVAFLFGTAVVPTSAPAQAVAPAAAMTSPAAPADGDGLMATLTGLLEPLLQTLGIDAAHGADPVTAVTIDGLARELVGIARTNGVGTIATAER
ncbi:N-acetylmuramoyl-L-alanine amidase [Skermania piniformis]|uniref:N-acetylmuramoyl-L-alanine amidase n=1 Tax=Skermania pinensis TaxID=39122 RepID=A0ABX8S8I1_9ACTN|nr:N-acetylmuramoyl-L-alanine amidase [Skermania piniformis]QXQ12810.1 N-acetylmuramoyl-L-alanine amidase [Skermania piniformis]